MLILEIAAVLCGQLPLQPQSASGNFDIALPRNFRVFFRRAVGFGPRSSSPYSNWHESHRKRFADPTPEL